MTGRLPWLPPPGSRFRFGHHRRRLRPGRPGLIQFVKQRLDRQSQGWQVVHDAVPDRYRINPVIDMDQPIAKTDDLHEIRDSCCHLRRGTADLVQCFGQDGKASLNCPLRSEITPVVSELHAAGEVLDHLRSPDGIPEAASRITLQRPAPASGRSRPAGIRSRPCRS